MSTLICSFDGHASPLRYCADFEAHPAQWIPRPSPERKYPFTSPACWPTGLRM